MYSQDYNSPCEHESNRLFPGAHIVYIVRPGDTVSAIAYRFNTTVQQIAIANNLANPDLIYPGQRLIIPIRMPGTEVGLPVLRQGATGMYVIYLERLLLANGYDIGMIEGFFNMRIRRAVEQVQRDRNLPITGVVDARTWRTLMAEAPEIVRPPAFPIMHTVQTGETLFSISQRYNISLQLLIMVNRIPNPNVIYPGMQILIPLQ